MLVATHGHDLESLFSQESQSNDQDLWSYAHELKTLLGKFVTLNSGLCLPCSSQAVVHSQGRGGGS